MNKEKKNVGLRSEIKQVQKILMTTRGLLSWAEVCLAFTECEKEYISGINRKSGDKGSAKKTLCMQEIAEVFLTVYIYTVYIIYYI